MGPRGAAAGAGARDVAFSARGTSPTMLGDAFGMQLIVGAMVFRSSAHSIIRKIVNIEY